ncbi:MAG TPA: 3-oxoacyl-ACP reductase [Gammaproteobacteria bacterium]|jgi:3-oxoacyl-[acyl-carrier protein] reductase|nr:SDR family oxidoreductase [Arenicellales bacterium]HCY12215.1 3-oxoacyl-ACP reductase [Gammaproteobacteria bacterium]
MDLGLAGKRIMVAAASRGLGYGIARQLALAGARVSIAAPTEPAIHQAAERLAEESGAEVVSFAFDARDRESILRWRDGTLERLGGIDGLVINAGGPPAGCFDDFDDAEWQAAFDLTLLSAVRMIRAVLPSMRRGGGGSIVTVTSSSVKEPIDVLLLSNVMRSGVVSLAKSLSQQLAPEGIRVNNLVPGSINTDRLKALVGARAEALDRTFEDVWAERSAAIPLGRFGEADEFGRAGAFLLSDAASYITGETLVVDGGAMKTVW